MYMYIPDIEFLTGFMFHKWFNDEIGELSFRSPDLHLIAHLVGQPLPHTIQIHVHLDQPQLATTLDQLVWLHN